MTYWWQFFKNLWRLIKPWMLLFVILENGLGLAAAAFLGHPIEWDRFLWGVFSILSFAIGGMVLKEYFERNSMNPRNSKVLGEQDEQIKPGAGLMIAFASITSGLLFMLISMNAHGYNSAVVLTSGITLLSVIFLTTPPISLFQKGYGEIVLAFLLTVWVPVSAYAFQVGKIDDIILILSLPLYFFLLAWLIMLEFPYFASDFKSLRKSFLIRLGWKNAINAHDLFLGLGIAAIPWAIWRGIPQRIVLPLFILVPFAGLQIWHLRRVAAGYKPNWIWAVRLGGVIYAMALYILILRLFIF